MKGELIRFTISIGVMVGGGVVAAVIVLYVLNFLSYSVLKNRILERQRWGLNICCGRTDGGGVNADIAAHDRLPNLVIVDVYHLPFRDGHFDTVLCSHTVEHVANPSRFFDELTRVGREVTIVIPPPWDLSAVLNVFEHRWIFLSFKKAHRTLPRHIKLPCSSFVQDRLGQRIHA
jgi:SAM-dependent methyltransferase